MTQIREGLSKADPKPMLIRMVEESNLSTDKKPSPELVSLIVQAGDLVERYEHVAYEAKELVKKIKTKAKEEGFGVFEIGLLARTVLKDKFSPNQLTYWFPMPKSNNLPDEITNRTDDVEKELEQTSSTEPPKDEEEYIGSPEAKHQGANAFDYKPEPEEDPKDLEIQFLKEQVAELQDALKKTEQFKPATAFEVENDMKAEPHVKNMGFEFLREVADGAHSFYYDTYGIELFQNRILSQLKNSGVKVFRRLYFEV